MGQLYDEDWEHVDIEAYREAIIGNGVISGLQVTQSDIPGMTVKVSLGLCTVDSIVYEEVSNQNLNISNGDATHDRKDIVVYDTTAGNPAVVAGTPAAAPIPADIPAGDILLGIVLVEANEVTSILDADITEDRVYAIDRWAHTSVSANTTLNDAHHVVTVNATGGVRTITLPTAAGILGKVYVVKKIDSSANAVTVDGNAAETIDGVANAVLSLQWSSVIVESDGANWIKVATDKTSNEIRDSVEAATNSNTFTDADHTKVNSVETSADVTDSTNVAAAGAVMDADFSAAEGFMRKTGSGAYVAMKSNMNAAVAPTVNDDTGDGYIVGSRWLDTTHNMEYICLDNSSAAAVWVYFLTPLLNASTGTYMFHSSDVSRSKSGIGFGKIKESVVNATGTIKVSFYANAGGNAGQCRIYRNGVAVGTNRSLSSTATYTEDISGWSFGDLLQIYGQSNYSYGSMTISKLRLYSNALYLLTIAQDP